MPLELGGKYLFISEVNASLIRQRQFKEVGIHISRQDEDSF